MTTSACVPKGFKDSAPDFNPGVSVEKGPPQRGGRVGFSIACPQSKRIWKETSAALFLLRHPDYGGQVGISPTTTYRTKLTVVFALLHLLVTCPLRSAERTSIPTPNRLDIRVQANAFGNASPADIAVVLRSAASELFRYCPRTQLAGIDVYYRSDHPEIDSKRTPGGRIAMALSARDTHWAQYSFQFSHEFCHALANYADGSQTTLSDQPNANLWLEESLCETASLFSLRAMSRAWQTDPPHPALRAYAPWLADYVNQRLSVPENRLPAGTSFSTWLRHHEPALRKEAERRDWNTTIATKLLPIFEAEPAGWEAVTFLNRGRSNGGQSLSDHFAQWQANCPGNLRLFVSKLAAVFGVGLA